MTRDYKFPKDFVWGTATSAYQIEGSPTADGAGRSMWHRFSHTPGNTWMDETGDVACDHYRRYKDDGAIMAELGVNATGSASPGRASFRRERVRSTRRVSISTR